MQRQRSSFKTMARSLRKITRFLFHIYRFSLRNGIFPHRGLACFHRTFDTTHTLMHFFCACGSPHRRARRTDQLLDANSMMSMLSPRARWKSLARVETLKKPHHLDFLQKSFFSLELPKCFVSPSLCLALLPPAPSLLWCLLLCTDMA